jgi:hypothetical protein
MSTITLRATKGTPLTNTEIDANFTALNADKVESSAVAYALLNTNSAVGTGASQVAKGDHTHAEFASFPVKDTTLQANLNADQVDGFDASQSVLANNIAVRDASGNLPGDILGNAATASDASLLEGSDVAAILSAAAAAAAPANLKLIYTTSASFTRATYGAFNYLNVTVVGGGGGSGGLDGSGNLGGGGGGGGTSVRKILFANVGTSETVTVGGGGGVGGLSSVGTTGTQSIFGAHATGNGGIGGSAGDAGQNGGAGGTAGGTAAEELGVLNQTGQAGGDAVNLNTSGSGGATMLGVIGAGGNSTEAGKKGIVIVEVVY